MLFHSKDETPFPPFKPQLIKKAALLIQLNDFMRMNSKKPGAKRDDIIQFVITSGCY